MCLCFRVCDQLADKLNPERAHLRRNWLLLALSLAPLLLSAAWRCVADRDDTPECVSPSSALLVCFTLLPVAPPSLLLSLHCSSLMFSLCAPGCVQLPCS